jgi:hypothetical protein
MVTRSRAIKICTALLLASVVLLRFNVLQMAANFSSDNYSNDPFLDTKSTFTAQNSIEFIHKPTPSFSRDKNNEFVLHSNQDYIENVGSNNYSFYYTNNVSYPLTGYDYVIRPSCQSNQQGSTVACTCGQSQASRSTVILAYVMSSPGEFEKRLLARQTWLSQGGVRYRHLSLVLMAVFVLGLPASPHHNWTAEMQRRLEGESAAYGDIVQKNFEDTYANLSLKSVAALDWVREHCSAAGFLLKIDDDVFVNTPALMQYVSGILGYEQQQQRPTMHCYLKRYSPVMRWSRNAISASIYPHPSYPLFCAGYAYMMDRAAAGAIHTRSLTDAGYFLNEDALVTGFLAGRARVVFRPLNQHYVKRGAVFYRNKVLVKALNYRNNSSTFFFIHRLQSEWWRVLWRNILAMW